MFVCVRASMSASVRLRSRPCLYVRVRESAFVRVHIIKRPEASGRIDNDASGCVFRSRTFVMHYRSGGCLQPRELGFSDSLMYMYTHVLQCTCACIYCTCTYTCIFNYRVYTFLPAPASPKAKKKQTPVRQLTFQLH